MTAFAWILIAVCPLVVVFTFTVAQRRPGFQVADRRQDGYSLRRS